MKLQKFTKKQLEAIEYLKFDLDELDNKPRRLFSSLRRYTEAFITEKDSDELKKRIIAKINEFEEYYYLFINVPDMVRDVAETAMEAKVELKSRELYTKEPNEIRCYNDGVDDCAKEMSKKLIDKIIDWRS